MHLAKVVILNFSLAKSIIVVKTCPGKGMIFINICQVSGTILNMLVADASRNMISHNVSPRLFLRISPCFSAKVSCISCSLNPLGGPLHLSLKFFVSANYRIF